MSRHLKLIALLASLLGLVPGVSAVKGFAQGTEDDLPVPCADCPDVEQGADASHEHVRALTRRHSDLM